MLPKTTLIAPAGVSGQIHASGSGKNYDIAPDGTVIVDAVDVSALITIGYQHVPPTAAHRERPADAPPISSVAPGSHETGASALDPAKREALHRAPDVGTGQHSEDHGGAQPPHGKPIETPSTETSRAEAQAEIDEAARAGIDPAHRSQVANTGHMHTPTATAADQALMRGEDEPAKDVAPAGDVAHVETDAERDEREERERMPVA